VKPQKALRIGPPEEEEPAMLMTSMIDVIFILLAFFVCVSEVKRGALQVDIPPVDEAPASSDPADEREPIIVEVTKDNQIFVGGAAAPTPDEVDRLIASAMEKSGGKDAPVHLKGDKAASNGTMMRVVSHLAKAGLTRIEFAVQAGS
jgi:biopolymer transport protein ExbD